MDQAASEGGPAMSAAADEGQQKSPEEIEAEIEHTRAELGDTVEALARKADVKAQARDRIAQVRDTAQQKKDELTSTARAAAPDSAAAGAHHVVSTVQRKPVPFAVAGAFAGGVLVGWILRRR
jgi:chromosome segregation ATPase